MDLPPLDPPDADASLDVLEPLCAVFRRHLKTQSLKYTPERAQILDVILGFDGVFQAEQLIDELAGRDFRVSKATVYRTIKLLQEAGIIQQVLFNAEHAHYQLAYGRQPKDLLVRVDSDEIVAIEVPELVAVRDRICAELGLKPEGHRFQIYASKA